MKKHERYETQVFGAETLNELMVELKEDNCKDIITTKLGDGSYLVEWTEEI